jgi:hypothetical protein
MTFSQRARRWINDGSWIPEMVILIVGLVAALILVRCSEGSVERRTDRKWETAQAASVAVAQAAKAVTEAGGKAAAARIEKETSDAIQTVRTDADAARHRLRQRLRPHRAGGAGRADLPGTAGTAGQPDDPAGAELVVVQDREIARLSLKLIDVAEEGDVYRLQVLGWQAFWRELVAAQAAGRAVGATADGELERRRNWRGSNARVRSSAEPTR